MLRGVAGNSRSGAGVSAAHLIADMGRAHGASPSPPCFGFAGAVQPCLWRTAGPAPRPGPCWAVAALRRQWPCLGVGCLLPPTCRPHGSPGAGWPSALPWGGVAGLGAEGGLKVPEEWQRGGFPAPFSCLGSLWGLVESTTVAVTSRGRFPVPVRCQGRLRCPLRFLPLRVGTLSWGEALQNGRAGR